MQSANNLRVMAEAEELAYLTYRATANFPRGALWLGLADAPRRDLDRIEHRRGLRSTWKPDTHPVSADRARLGRRAPVPTSCSAAPRFRWRRRARRARRQGRQGRQGSSDARPADHGPTRPIAVMTH